MALALILCVACSVDERELLTTGTDAATGGGQPSVADLNTGGAGEAGEAPLPRCVYLGNSVEPGCETLVKNPGFSSNVAGWTAEDVGVSEAWLDVDATAANASGSLVVNNFNFKDDDTAVGGMA
ncbi:MAG TPA: hypothetical protein VHW01_17435, partial [Polyangiaceae bacterium]|nr:hypothetical protein [Polyangiaceae bacterium]